MFQMIKLKVGGLASQTLACSLITWEGVKVQIPEPHPVGLSEAREYAFLMNSAKSSKSPTILLFHPSPLLV